MADRNIDHLARAKDYIARGEDFYRKAAEEIVAALDADPTLGYGRIGKAIGRDESWARRLVQWSTNPSPAASTPFGGADERHRKDASAAKKVAREQPEAIAAAITEAPAEAQRKIADELIKAPSTERSLRSIAKKSSEPRSPREPKPIERRLQNATFTLWEVGEALLDEVPSDDERGRMLVVAKNAQQLAAGLVYLLDTGTFEDAFRELVEQMGADK